MSTSSVPARQDCCSKRRYLEAVQQIRKMRGGAQAQLMRASDRNYYVVKFQNNPQHVRVLANEYLATRLGLKLGLPMPHVEIIEISEWLIQHTTELRIESACGAQFCSSGLQVASRYATDVEKCWALDYLPESMFPRVRNRADFGRVLALDKWTGNSDGRQAVYSKSPKGVYYTATFVDQGYCFNAGEWNFPDLALHGTYYRNYVYQGVTSWESFEPALSRAEQMDIGEVWECASDIPAEWCGNDPDALPRLIEDLYARRAKIRDLITAFRESSRSPFPNWRRH